MQAKSDQAYIGIDPLPLVLFFFTSSLTVIPFSAYNGPKVLWLGGTASIYLFWPCRCKRIPLLHLASYGYLSRSQYVALPPLLPAASVHAVPTHCSEKEKINIYIPLPLSHCLTQKGQGYESEQHAPLQAMCIYAHPTVLTITATVEPVLRSLLFPHKFLTDVQRS
jgi:hypothetical protein